MTDQPRSVKISDDERGGWSSDRPRRNAGPPRPTDISVRGRVLRPSDRMRYSPGSLLLIVSSSAEDRERFVTRAIEDTGAVLSMGKVRTLLRGRVEPEELDARAAEVLDAAVAKRLNGGETVVLVLETLDPLEREPYVRAAAAVRRPRHLILIEGARAGVSEEDRPVLNELRRALDAGELGAEGIQTAMRLGGATVEELKRVVFRPAPRED